MLLLYKIFFRFRYSVQKKLFSFFRKLWYLLQGLTIGKGSNLPRTYFTWPHKVYIGSNCILEHDIYFKFDGIAQPGKAIYIQNNVFVGFGCEFNIRKKIVIGNDCLIASGCKFIDHDHGIAMNQLIRVQHGPEKEIHIGNSVWLGCNVVVLKGVTIGAGAVVAAGAVVTKSIPEYEIWAGIPARKIGARRQ